MLTLLIRLFHILILSTFEQITFFWNQGVYTPTLKKYQVVRDLKKFENHCFRVRLLSLFCLYNCAPLCILLSQVYKITILHCN